ncbi:hypothetical protein ABID19_006627 [Mesorhizobium robiniae]|uniref:Uncharacterized protein n=1 Tax=Mesorhizobium robiniae TaxID=559315 RepID=A0ABV2GZI7_9HYPH
MLIRLARPDVFGYFLTQLWSFDETAAERGDKGVAQT